MYVQAASRTFAAQNVLPCTSDVPIRNDSLTPTYSNKRHSDYTDSKSHVTFLDFGFCVSRITEASPPARSMMTH